MQPHITLQILVRSGVLFMQADTDMETVMRVMHSHTRIYTATLERVKCFKAS